MVPATPVSSFLIASLPHFPARSHIFLPSSQARHIYPRQEVLGFKVRHPCPSSPSSSQACHIYPLQVVPALDPATPVFCGPFVMKLVRRRMHEFSLFDERRFHEFSMNQPFKAGPFE
ncbi:hypothetical protein DUNSADRAFT_15175 [Dunaliella salina]|uniref:Uncharacterized protein n=1 Tax=Dunaliella salina TaxID=3046 RepID=A0ABQ7G5V5_DUNSA|nr:hypothetical protein DUNSADRAFT_15175 [Dunaliella salina]|eukprot:KAF5830001.1 hypothetical protein DUNSADRAFT_15175 [Dunaliella salina]